MELETTEYENLDSGISLMNLEEEDLTDKSIILKYDWLVNSSVHNIGDWQLDGSTSYSGKSYDQSLNAWSTSTKMTDRLFFRYKIPNKFFSKGSSLDVSLGGIMNNNLIGSEVIQLYNNKDAFSLKVGFVDGNQQTTKVDIDDFTIKFFPTASTYSLFFNVDDIPCDVYGFYIYLDYSIYAYDDLVNYIGTFNTMKHNGGIATLTIDIKETAVDKTDGLLNNIIQLVTNIKNGILNLPNFIASALKGFFDNIVNGLVELGNTLLEGIKNLFIPSQQDIVNMKEDWEQLLASRFGALYEVVELIDDYANTFQSSSKGTITFPSVSIPLGEADFVFGGWEVQVIPNGFDVLIGALKTIVSIACTVLFVNGLRNKFERLVTR